MNKKFDKNAKVEQLTKMLEGKSFFDIRYNIERKILIEKEPKGIQGEKSSKDMASSRNPV